MSGSRQAEAVQSWRANGSKRLESYPAGDGSLIIFRDRVWQEMGGQLERRDDLFTRQIGSLQVPKLEIVRR